MKQRVKKLKEKDLIRVAEGGFNPQELATIILLSSKINELIKAINQLKEK